MPCRPISCRAPVASRGDGVSLISDMSSQSSAKENPDGRRRRADTSRQRIVDAMMELMKAGEIAPSAETIALKAGVGRRTVFRLFSDMETVYAEIQHAMLARIEPLFSAPLEGRGWRAVFAACTHSTAAPRGRGDPRGLWADSSIESCFFATIQCDRTTCTISG